MQKLDFYGLPRSIQDRFIESSQGASAPLPLGFIPQRQGSGWLWGGGALLVAGLWAAFTAYGIGDLGSSFSVTTPAQKIMHGAFAVLAGFLAFQAYAKSWVVGQMPYQPGTYLFPGVVIEASFGQLVVYEAAEISSVRAEGAHLVVQIASRSVRFPCGSADMASIAAEKAQVGLDRWKASQADDQLERARLSPLVDSGIHNPLAPTEAHVRPHFLSPAVVFAICLVIGAAAGYGVAVWRDTLSQKALYKAAISENSIAAYRAYIDRGGNRPEVRRLLLPRAELQLAISKNSVEAIESFIKDNPKTEIAGEVHNALRAALLVELEKARKAGTLQAIEQLAQRYPDHELIAGEMAAARHAVFTEALADFKAKAPNVEPELLVFVERVIAFVEKHGPKVVVRVHHDFPQDPESLDQIVIKNHQYYMGVKSQPSQYFLGEYARRREKELLETVVAKLQPLFSEEIVKFEMQPLPAAANEELAELEVPALTFIHKEKLSGGYVGGKPRAMYLGAAITMTSLAQMPGDEQPLSRFDWSAWRNPDFSILVDREKDIKDVYEDMVGGAFSKFTEKYLARWL